MNNKTYKVKLIECSSFGSTHRDSYDDDYSGDIIAPYLHDVSIITDWETVTQEEYGNLIEAAKSLRVKDKVIIVLTAEKLSVKKTISDYLANQAAAKRDAELRQQKAEEDRKREKEQEAAKKKDRALRKLAKNEDEQKKLLIQLQQKFPEVAASKK